MKKLILLCIYLSLAYSAKAQDQNPNVTIITDSCFLSPVAFEWKFSDSLITMRIAYPNPEEEIQIDTIPVLGISNSSEHHGISSRRYMTESWGPICIYYSTDSANKPVGIGIPSVAEKFFAKDGEMHWYPVKE